jgi:hypothetical protein
MKKSSHPNRGFLLSSVVIPSVKFPNPLLPPTGNQVGFKGCLQSSRFLEETHGTSHRGFEDTEWLEGNENCSGRNLHRAILKATQTTFDHSFAGWGFRSFLYLASWLRTKSCAATEVAVATSAAPNPEAKRRNLDNISLLLSRFLLSFECSVARDNRKTRSGIVKKLNFLSDNLLHHKLRINPLLEEVLLSTACIRGMVSTRRLDASAQRR